MRKRKITDGVQRSARQKNRNCSDVQSTSDQDADTNKNAHLPNANQSTEKEPPKKLKCDQNHKGKHDVNELHIKDGDTHSKESTPEDFLNSVQGSKPISDGKCTALSTEETISTNLVSDLNERAFYNASTDNSEDGTAFSHMIQSELSKKRDVCLENSPFIDEDSNQPMPLGRFFENADLMQDLPPVAPSYASMSRREFRNLHFRAKEDDDDDYVNDLVNEENI
ncbi:hypothetical protein GDO86_012575 [Hymenochirus boettgeri]|uniref:Uncharacterized protein n=1 Tax=Hymenochirus boettgeri TaxID=247094 RepID=A0A8T2IUX4_9PIPI|nr:hypothetical protein GDO86_012575 [Hymenochirus boettgeri]